MAKIKSSASSRHLNNSQPASNLGEQDARVQAIDFVTMADPERGQQLVEGRPYDMWAADPARHRSPFPFRIRPHFPIPLRLPFLVGRPATQPRPRPSLPLRPLQPVSALPPWNDPAGGPDLVWPDTSSAADNGHMPQTGG